MWREREKGAEKSMRRQVNKKETHIEGYKDKNYHTISQKNEQFLLLHK